MARVPTDSRLDELLEKSSRTFALAIPTLPEPTRSEVVVAYLLFRVADTLEDATLWPPRRKVRELEAFRALLEPSDAPDTGKPEEPGKPGKPGERGNPSTSKRPDVVSERARVWSADPPVAHDGYLELLSELPLVFGALEACAPEARRWIADYTGRTAERMAGFAGRVREGETLQLRDLDDLRAYCYAVAGLVGEMLTELFLLGRPQLEPVAGQLRRDAAVFGEALQLVNILKDAADDADEGRRFLPAGVDRARVFALAREDLDVATSYVHRLQEHGAPRGLVEFTGMPVALARATLDTVERDGPGSKISRETVFALIGAMAERLDAGRPALS